MLRTALAQLTDWLEPQLLLPLAQHCGFTCRKARKRTPLLFVQATVLLVSQSVVSFRRWAVLVGVLGSLCLSKQALWERITPRAGAFLQAVLAHALHRRLARAVPACQVVLAGFPRVLIQDSTTLKLSPKLAQVYGLRWRIETIFKAWKSHFRLTEVPRGSAAQLEAMLYAWLIFVTVFA